MFDIISQLISEAGVVLEGPVIQVDETNRYIAFIEVKRNSAMLQEPSNRLLNEIRLKLADVGVILEFILLDATSRDIEIGVRATLIHGFGSFVRNSFLSLDGNNAVIWVIPKKHIDDEIKEQIERTASVILTAANFRFGGLRFPVDENVPSRLASLSIIRTIAPANQDDIITAARSKGFIIPSADWMSRSLDALRKARLVVRLRDGHYVLSHEGLSKLGTAKNRGSPDVARMLDLARRRR